jgi:hypothetical protein
MENANTLELKNTKQYDGEILSQSLVPLSIQKRRKQMYKAIKIVVLMLITEQLQIQPWANTVTNYSPRANIFHAMDFPLFNQQFDNWEYIDLLTPSTNKIAILPHATTLSKHNSTSLKLDILIGGQDKYHSMSFLNVLTIALLVIIITIELQVNSVIDNRL